MNVLIAKKNQFFSLMGSKGRVQSTNSHAKVVSSLKYSTTILIYLFYFSHLSCFLLQYYFPINLCSING